MGEKTRRKEVKGWMKYGRGKTEVRDDMVGKESDEKREKSNGEEKWEKRGEEKWHCQ